ncbi:MAG TPA: helix-turn-helix domain-containing protein [Solirubrobacteraceae bacterium]|nr:helix-turn-helix domain-containing protein [Solirubrobacteraceae bacterium]
MSSARATGPSTIGLLEGIPELSDFLSPEERLLVARVAIPAQSFSGRPIDMDELLERSNAFAAVILDGLLLHRLAIGEQPALRLLGRGDMIARSGGMRTSILSESSYCAGGQLSLGLLDDRVLLTARRFPRLFTGLQARLGEQHQRLAAQLAICQLPRVEDRLLSLMWLLAETWGRVTPSGTVLPMALTHDALGELIGARRPTVTLALKELAERGSLFRQDGEWLLLEPPPQGSAPPAGRAAPEVVPLQPTQWSAPTPAPLPPRGLDQLRGTLTVLRDSHERVSGEIEARFERVRRTRQRTQALRDQISRQRLSRRPAPAPARRPVP